MSRSLLTVTNRTFLPGLVVLLSSLESNLKGFAQTPMVVLIHNGLNPPTETDCARITSKWPNVSFRNVESSFYAEAPRVNSQADNSAYITLEAFRKSEFEQLLFVDADMLCLRDFSDVFESAVAPFVGCSVNHDVVPKGVVTRGPAINTGFFLLSGELLAGTHYEHLIDLAKSNTHPFLRDQSVINKFLRGRPRQYCSSVYNERNWDRAVSFSDQLSKIRIVHYSGYSERPKPWSVEAPVETVGYRLWHNYAVQLVEDSPEFINYLPHLSAQRERIDAAAAAFVDAEEFAGVVRMETDRDRQLLTLDAEEYLRHFSTDVGTDPVKRPFVDTIRACCPPILWRAARSSMYAIRRIGQRG